MDFFQMWAKIGINLSIKYVPLWAKIGIKYVPFLEIDRYTE